MINRAELTRLTYSFIHLTISVVSKKLGLSKIFKLRLGSTNARNRDATASAMCCHRHGFPITIRAGHADLIVCYSVANEKDCGPIVGV